LFITQREKRTLLYIIPLIVLLGLLLYVLTTKAPLFKKKSIGCIICHPLKFYAFSHPLYAKVQCLSCHTTHENNGRGQSKLIASIPKLCLDCHKTTKKSLEKKNVHKPFEKGKCMACHSPHGSNNSYVLNNQAGHLCRSCHYLLKFTSKKDQHFPYEQGLCIVCHSGHASDINAQLVDNQKTLCLSCHQSIALDVNKPYQMKPFTEGKCTQCHNPHSSDNNKQLQKPLVQLCVGCHQDVYSQFKLPSSHPVIRKQLITCLNCHVPHGSWYAKLLQRPFDKTVSGCGACHVPHGSNNQFLANLSVKNGDVSAVCEQCHVKKTYDEPYTHPVKDKYDPNAKTQLSCISTCHQNLYWPNMKTFENEICLLCHTGHNSPAAAIGSKTAKQTELLKSSIENIRKRRWEDAPPKNITVQAPRISVQVPGGKTKVAKNNLSPDASKLIGQYHRLPSDQQFKIKSDKGCMLCHQIAALP
jgi:predicted CXXCH cytochrome family protein